MEWAKNLKVTTMMTIALLLSTAPAYGNLTDVLALDCGEDAILLKEGGDHTYPPNEQCWGWYRGHLYPVSYGVRSVERIVEEPIRVSGVSARITGGPSELNRSITGFKLQVLPTMGVVDKGRGLTAIKPESVWKTLATFSAPCASGVEVLVHWEGTPVEAEAIRVVAPEGHYVDKSVLWVEYGRT